MEENVNINVKKKKMSLVPILFIIIVILLIVLGILLYDKTNKNNVGTILKEQENVESNVNNKDNVNNEENVNNIETNEQEQQNTQTNQSNNDAITKVYEKIGDEYWASKKENTLLKVVNGEIIYSVRVGNEQKINFEYGKVKCADFGPGNGIPDDIIVINENGEVYNIKFNDGVNTGDSIDQSKFTTSKIEFEEKIIDFSVNGGEGVVLYSGPYYLTESGKLLREDGKTYAEINRNHIYRIGGLGQSVYINKDNTLEVLRVNETYEYMSIVDENGKKIRARAVFYESSERWSVVTQDHFYAVDENNKLVHFYEGSLMVADEYYEAREKTVSRIEYNQNALKIEIFFTDGTSIIIDKVYHYKKLY